MSFLLGKKIVWTILYFFVSFSGSPLSPIAFCAIYVILNWAKFLSPLLDHELHQSRNCQLILLYLAKKPSVLAKNMTVHFEFLQLMF